MIACLYLLSVLCLYLSFRKKLCLSCCYLFCFYFCGVYFLKQSSVSWHNYYLVSFLLCFSLGAGVCRNLSILPCINFGQLKDFLKKVLYVIFSLLFLFVACRIVYGWIFIEKSFVNIRHNLGLNISYWENIIFFRVSLFILPLVVFSIRNRFFKIFFWFLFLVVLLIPLHKTIVFFYCMIILLTWVLLKNKNIILSLKQSFSLAVSGCFIIWLVMCLFNKRVLPLLQTVSLRPFLSVSKICYRGLEYSEKNNIHTYGIASFKKLFSPFFRNHMDFSKELFTFCHGIPKEKNAPGVSMNTPSPIPLYLDFGWFALIFAFLLGVYLKTIDTLMINFCRNNKITLPVAISYSCCLVGSSMFMITAMGTALLSGGMFLYSVLLFLFINLERNAQKTL